MTNVSIESIIHLLYNDEGGQGVVRGGCYNLNRDTFILALSVYEEHGVNILPFFDWLTHLGWRTDNQWWDERDFEIYGKYKTGKYYIKLKDDSFIDSVYRKAIDFQKKLLTYEHRRYLASQYIRKSDIRKAVMESDNYKCNWCGSTDNLTIDHIKPVVKGGEDCLSNLQTLCKSCNSSKGGK